MADDYRRYGYRGRAAPEIVAQLLSANTTPTNIGEGLANAGRSIAAGIIGAAGRRDDEKRRQAFAEALGSTAGAPGQMDAPGPSMDGAAGFEMPPRRADTTKLAQMLIGASPDEAAAVQALMRDDMERQSRFREDMARQQELQRAASAPQKMPSSVQEYQFAREQGFEGSFADWEMQRRKAGSTQVNVGGSKYGAIPPGYQVIEDPETGSVRMEVIPGGPAAREEEATQKKSELRQQSKETDAGIVVDDIDRVLQMVDNGGLFIAGPVGAGLSFMSGTKAHDASKLLDTIKAMTSFEYIQKMREASPTGGALGQVSDKENKKLEAARGNLELSQMPEQLTYNLRRLKEIYLDTIHGVGNRPGMSLEENRRVPGGGMMNSANAAPRSSIIGDRIKSQSAADLDDDDILSGLGMR